jgi:lipopolysaccharide biosynthesis glycosyltransferase
MNPADPIRVFLGYDTREPVAFQVASHSIQTRCSVPVAITPLALPQLGSIFQRPRDPKQSTDFSFSRFLIPSLCGYEGWALFADCDILVLDDLARLWALRDERYAVMVVQHNHQPRETVKFLNQEQTRYEKKNWSSVMLFNNALCRALTPAYVQQATGLDLHRFHWLESENLIGALPQRWNWLVDYHPTVPASEVSLLHFTSGGPYFEAYRNCSYHTEWFQELSALLRPLPPLP